MGIIEWIKGKNKQNLGGRYARMLDGSVPVFSNFGRDIYASDIIDRCTAIKAREMSKLMPKHIRNFGDRQEMVNGRINALLRYAPNELMTTSDFLSKCTWLYEKNYNCFIYPAYDLITLNNGNTKKIYTGFYPLNPEAVTLLEDDSGIYYLKMEFGDGYSYTLPYSDVIHWRKDFAINSFLGGDENGQPRDSMIIGSLKTERVITEGLEKAVKSSMSIRGVLKINTMLDTADQERAREDFERKIRSSESGILPIDLKNEYIPINTEPVTIDSSTLEFVQKKILAFTGVSYAIYTGNFTDEEYQAFYESELEQKIISLGQAFTKTLFTQRELGAGNEVIFYGQKLLFTNTKNKIAVADILGNRGALTDNQLLELFGYPPYEGGDVRRQSLNFIDSSIANEYQLSNNKKSDVDNKKSNVDNNINGIDNNSAGKEVNDDNE